MGGSFLRRCLSLPGPQDCVLGYIQRPPLRSGLPGYRGTFCSFSHCLEGRNPWVLQPVVLHLVNKLMDSCLPTPPNRKRFGEAPVAGMTIRRAGRKNIMRVMFTACATVLVNKLIVSALLLPMVCQTPIWQQLQNRTRISQI